MTSHSSSSQSPSPPQPTRPNIYPGPPSTWRSHTQNERAVATSLTNTRAQDLSIHLYNAFALKSRVLRRAVGGQIKGKGKGKVEAEVVAGNDFMPPDVWTAWPMPLGEVPRERCLPSIWGDENVNSPGSWRRNDDVKPSAVLEEALLGVITKVGRERWMEREWKESTSGSEIVEEEEEEEEEGEEDDESMRDATEEDADELDTGRPMYSSQAFDALLRGDSTSPDEGKKLNTNNKATSLDQRPVPLADDDRARRLLLPSIRHIISKADDLLAGLQKAREAYAGKWNKPRSNDGTSTVAEDTDADVETSRSRSIGMKSRKRARATSVDSEASMASARSGSRKPSSKKPLKLRDWSDLLGMAVLTGWNADVVQRAAERCSALFGEDMLFRTFHDGSIAREKSYFTEKLASGLLISEEDGEELLNPVKTEPVDDLEQTKLDLSEISRTTIICPVMDCPQPKRVYVRPRNMYAHVRKAHPEIDIGQLKKLVVERIGDGRGKYDRSKSRQRSSSAAAESST